MTLYERVGNLVAGHRRRKGLTQQKLAELCGLSPEMISRIENGHNGLRFSRIEDLANALEIDPAELFIADPVPGRDMREPLLNLTAKLARLSDADLVWADQLFDAAFRSRS